MPESSVVLRVMTRMSGVSSHGFTGEQSLLGAVSIGLAQGARAVRR